jgi:hypothetical protein
LKQGFLGNTVRSTHRFRSKTSKLESSLRFVSCILGLKTYKKALFRENLCGESFLEFLSPKLQTLTLNIKSTKGSKILKSFFKVLLGKNIKLTRNQKPYLTNFNYNKKLKKIPTKIFWRLRGQ